MSKQLSTRTRAIRTGIQSVVAFLAGLIATVWAVDGVPQAVFNYVSNELVFITGFTGIFGVALGWYMNRGEGK